MQDITVVKMSKGTSPTYSLDFEYNLLQIFIVFYPFVWKHRMLEEGLGISHANQYRKSKVLYYYMCGICGVNFTNLTTNVQTFWAFIIRTPEHGSG